jgi:cytochrome c oxidase subunit 2
MLQFLGLPPDWSADGHEIDSLIGWIHWLMLVLFVGWGIYFLYALFRFRAGRNPQATHADAKAKVSKYVEIGVVIAEVVLLVGLALPMWAKRVDDFPDENDATVVHVVAQQFAWNFHYPGPDGVFGSRSADLIDDATNPIGLDPADPASADDITTINQLYLPVDKPVIFHLTSRDVIHSFNVPYLRLKHDAIPGMSIPLWTVPVETGDSEIACAQLCGLTHYRMKGFLHVQTQAEFQAWLDEQGS